MSTDVAHFPRKYDLRKNWPKSSRNDVRGSVPGRTDKADVSAQVDVILPFGSPSRINSTSSSGITPEDDGWALPAAETGPLVRNEERACGQRPRLGRPRVLISV
jgi:hypothetical protein